MPFRRGSDAAIDDGAGVFKSDAITIVSVPRTAVQTVVASDMPGFLTFLGAAGTAAMIWVGGSIIVHTLEAYGVHSVGQAINSASEAAAHALPYAGGLIKWTVTAFLSGIVGLSIGAVSIPVIGFAVAPAWKQLKGILRKRR